jgi:YaaC-like Protein
MPTMSTQYWRDALQLESAELVKRLYKKIHDRELNVTRARQIVSAYLQGREYYQNALQADISVQPLLLFYGVSSLSRALTLLLKLDGGEETLTQAHGLNCCGWNGVLTTDVRRGLKALGQLQVQSSGGMFTDLMNAIGNRSCLHVHSGKVDWFVSYPILLPVKLVFLDIVQRIPDLEVEYTLWTERLPLVLYVHEITQQGDGVKIVVRKQDNVEDIIRYAGERIRIAGEEEKFTTLETTGHCSMFVNSFVKQMFGSIPMLYMCATLPSGMRISQIPLTFILSYYLGMLCRYYPSHWIALSRGILGDEAWPLMRACLSYIEVAYPQLVMETIENKSEK